MLTVQIARRTRPRPRRKQFCGQHQRRHTLPHAYALPYFAVFIPQTHPQICEGFL